MGGLYDSKSLFAYVRRYFYPFECCFVAGAFNLLALFHRFYRPEFTAELLFQQVSDEIFTAQVGSGRRLKVVLPGG